MRVEIAAYSIKLILKLFCHLNKQNLRPTDIDIPMRSDASKCAGGKVFLRKENLKSHAIL